MENSKEDPQKAKNRTTIWSSSCTPGYTYKENKSTNSKHACFSMFRAELFRIANIWKQPEHPSTNE